MRHKLTERILEDLRRLGIKATAAMLEAFDLLDGIAQRASVAGHAAIGRSGRKQSEIDTELVARLHSEGVSGTEIAKRIGVSQATVSRIIRGVR